jgi:hypothetical protein
MSYYYVSQAIGIDINDGLTPASPFATIGAAVDLAVAGDTVYVGPGEYAERVVLAASGTSGNTIKFLADPVCEFLTECTKGRVFVTWFSGGLPQAGSVVNCNAKAYNEFHGFGIVGSADVAITGAANCTFYDCYIQAGTYGQSGAATLVDTSVLSGQYGTTGNTLRCVISAGLTCCSGGSHDSTLVFASDAGFKDGAVCRNCTAIGGEGGFVTSFTADNCTAIGCCYGFYGGATADCNYCTAMHCRYGFYGTGTSSAALQTDANCFVNSCATSQRGSGYEATTVTAVSAVYFDWYEAAKKLEPWYQGLATRIASNSNYPSTDLVGKVRPLGNGTASRGVWEANDYEVSYTAGDYYNTPPAWWCRRKGQGIFYIPVDANKNVNITVLCKWVGVTGSKPSVILRGDGISITTSTCTAASGVWQSLAVSATTTQDAVLELVCQGNDTADTAYCYFSDFNIQLSPGSSGGVKYGTWHRSCGASVFCSPTVIPGGGGGGGTNEYGNVFYADGSANFSLNPGHSTTAAILFRAPKTGTMSSFNVEWKVSSGYGAGTLGVYTWGLYATNSSCQPTGGALATVTGWTPTGTDGSQLVTMSASLTAGTMYALRVDNTDSSPASNWASNNTGMSYIYDYTTSNTAFRGNTAGTFGGDMCCRLIVYSGGSWHGWCSTSDPWYSSATDNGSETPLSILYSDSTRIGNCLYSGHAGTATVTSTNKISQYIASWAGGNVTIATVGSLLKVTTAGHVYIDLCTGSGTVLATADCGTVSSSTWFYGTLNVPVTLANGSAYRLVVRATSGSFTLNISYGENMSQWNGAILGGSGSNFQYNNGSGWSTYTSPSAMPCSMKTA